MKNLLALPMEIDVGESVDGWSLLRSAAMIADRSIIQLFKARGADINQPAILNHAISAKNTDVIDYLLDEGVPIVNDHFVTAVKEKEMAILKKLLVRSSPSATIEGNSVLKAAVLFGGFRVLKHLLQIESMKACFVRGEDGQIIDVMFESLNLAASLGKKTMVALLIRRRTINGPRTCLRDAEVFQTAFLAGKTEIADILVKIGTFNLQDALENVFNEFAQLDTVSSEQMLTMMKHTGPQYVLPLFYLSIKHGLSEEFVLFLHAGSVDLKRHGKKALHLASHRQNSFMSEILVGLGVDIDLDAFLAAQESGNEFILTNFLPELDESSLEDWSRMYLKFSSE